MAPRSSVREQWILKEGQAYDESESPSEDESSSDSEESQAKKIKLC